MIARGRTSVPALERGLNIQQRLHRLRDRGATAAELQRALKIPIASIYRILALLERSGHVWQDGAGHYRPGEAQIVLGFGAHAASPLVRAAQSVLRTVAAQSHEMSELAVRTGRWDLMMLDTWQTEGTPLRIRSRPGLTFELAPTTPHGHCFLAFGPARMLEEFLKVPEHRQYLDQRKYGDLYGDRESWRSLGFAWHRKTGPGDIARVAAPVFDPGKSPPRLIGTLGIAVDAARLTTFRASQWGHLLKSAAHDIESRLG